MTKLTKEEIEKIIDLYNKGNNCSQIAKEFNVSVTTISKYLIKNNISIRRHQQPISNEQIIKLYLSGMSTIKIGKDYKMDRNRISSILKDNGIDVVNRQNVTKFNENVFDTIDTEEKAYWLGFLYADGNICHHVPGRKPRYSFELSLCEQDKSHLDKFNKFMEYQGDNVKKKVVKSNNKEFIAYRWIINTYECN